MKIFCLGINKNVRNIKSTQRAEIAQNANMDQNPQDIEQPTLGDEIPVADDLTRHRSVNKESENSQFFGINKKYLLPIVGGIFAVIAVACLIVLGVYMTKKPPATKRSNRRMGQNVANSM